MRNTNLLGSMLVLIALMGVGALTLAQSDETAVPTPATDAVMARNLQAMSSRPGVLELDWRQPKERVPGQSPAPLSLQADRFPDAEALTAISEYSDANAGHGVLVWYKGDLVLEHFAENVTAATPFSAFSMHKSIVGIAVLAAIEDGILSGLDASVGDYIPEWRDDPRGTITLRQLLQQVSGLEHVAMNSGDARAGALVLSSRVSDTALSYQLSGKPGSEFNYNNVNSQILGIALSNALGARDMRYAEYLSERLWRPLGNADAQLWLEDTEGDPRFYSGLEAGLADWLRVGIMLASGGKAGEQQLLSTDSLAALTAPGELNAGYGLNLWRGDNWEAQRRYGPTTPLTVPHKEPYLAGDLIYFDGFGGQRLYVVPSQQLVIARFGEVSMSFDDSVLPNTLLRALQAERLSESYRAYKSEESDAVYAERFAQLQREAQNGRGLASYDPLIPLPGTPSYEPLPRGDASWLQEGQRDWLSSLGAGSNSEAIMIWRDGEVVYEEYFGNGGADQLVVSRSLSKPLSVVAVGRALQTGYLDSLDVPASRYLTEWQGTDREAITLRQLLQMRSGLLPQGRGMEPDNVLNRAYLHPYHDQVILHEYPLVDEPGERYEYSNANAELIAPILERATGRTYEQWLTEQVLRPLGAAGGDIWVNRIGGTAHAGCCARLPAETYLRLAVLYINDGLWDGRRLLPEGYVEEITTSTPQNPHTGMGLYVAGPYIEARGAAHPDVPFGKTQHSEPYLDRDLYLFDGNGNQVVYIVPRHRLIALRVGTRPPKDRPWDNSAMPNKLLTALKENAGAELVAQSSNR